MKVALHNPFFGQEVAETELCRRIDLACKTLGWTAIETDSVEKIQGFYPDFVLLLHFRIPKLTGFPTYGCMWNPPVFFQEYDKSKQQPGKAEKNILSCDAYLSASPLMEHWLNDRCKEFDKKFFVVPFYPSCSKTEYQTPNLSDPKITYIGSNWDGQRFKSLFRRLDRESFFHAYGRSQGWQYLRHSYRGPIPFDGHSLIQTLHRSGISLCLHKEEHLEAAMPSMRIFESVASGAIAICDRHPFVEKYFGDTVLYLDRTKTGREQVAQLRSHIAWVSDHNGQALEMSRSAHRIFAQKFSLESLLCEVGRHHERLITEKGFTITSKDHQCLVENNPDDRVEFIVRIGERSLPFLKRSLDSIVRQSLNKAAIILVAYQEVEGIHEFIQSSYPQFPIKLVHSKQTGFRSSQIIDGLKEVTSKYFAILDDDDIIYVNHIATLLGVLDAHPEVGLAYSASLRISEDQEFSIKDVSLDFFETYSLPKMVGLKNFIPSNCWIARSSLIDPSFLKDPCMVVAEDFYLLLKLSQKAAFYFSHEVTCAFYWRVGQSDNVTSHEAKDHSGKIWQEADDQLLQLFWDSEFYVSLCQDFDLDFSEGKVVKFSLLRATTSQSMLGQTILTQCMGNLSNFQKIRKLYLKITAGGELNEKPNILVRFLVFLKRTFMS